MIKPFDIIIVLVLSVLPFYQMPSLLIDKQREKKKQKFTRFLLLTEKEIERFELSESTPHEEFIYFPHDDQYNIIEVMERVSVIRGG